MNDLNPDLVAYIETNIFPQYEDDAGHGLGHIRYVISRSLKFADALSADQNLAYVAAAFHDLGRKIDNEHHEIESAKLFLADDFMKSFFTEDERKLIAEAIEDHRASSDHHPRNLIGEIVSSADRSTSLSAAVKRGLDYNRKFYPDRTFDEICEIICPIFRKKFGPDGYAREKMFVKDPDYKKFLEDMARITSDLDAFKNFAKML